MASLNYSNLVFKQYILTNFDRLRKEMVSAENMQLMIEAENNRLAKADLMNQIRSQQERCHELEQENLFLKSGFPQSSQNEIPNEKYASLLERNKLLSEWREQVRVSIKPKNILFSIINFCDAFLAY